VAVAYLMPSEFVAKMVDAGESKIFMSTRDTVIRAFMAGAILALAAAFAVTINVQTGGVSQAKCRVGVHKLILL
jgi:formate/nitrite transporter FocA (FNT family)